MLAGRGGIPYLLRSPKETPPTPPRGRRTAAYPVRKRTHRQSEKSLLALVLTGELASAPAFVVTIIAPGRLSEKSQPRSLPKASERRAKVVRCELDQLFQCRPWAQETGSCELLHSILQGAGRTDFSSDSSRRSISG